MNAMLKLSAFADEISPNLDEQIRVCRENNVTHFELRGVAGKNVLDFDNALRNEIKDQARCQRHGGSSASARRSGRLRSISPGTSTFDRFKIAVELAEFFGAPLIRVFSYYPAGGEGKGELDAIRDEVLKRFREKIDYIKNRNVTLIHENEKGHLRRRRAALHRSDADDQSPEIALRV
jgi:sugar phosphate isomerase/epimerase